jgi:hypothetical protein
VDVGWMRNSEEFLKISKVLYRICKKRYGIGFFKNNENLIFYVSINKIYQLGFIGDGIFHSQDIELLAIYHEIEYSKNKYSEYLEMPLLQKSTSLH